MQCCICEEPKSQLSCAECAQAGLWSLRTEYLFRIAERDEAAENVQEYLDTPAEANAARREELRDRIAKARAERERIGSSLEADRVRLKYLRAETEEKHRRLEQAQELAPRQEHAMEAAQRDIKRLNTKWRSLYNRTAEARSFSCREAAGLYGVRVKRRKSGRADYLIGGVPIPNLLQDLNAHTFISINTSLAHLAHLLMLVSHYLGLKMPNEIVLPERNVPTTSIKGVLHNRHLATRPLYLECPLPQLSRENPATHTKFIEGVSMLAMNIAWLCFSQGLEINDVEEACNLGHNVWKLLVARDSAATTTTFGRTSHSTAHDNLATPPGQQLMSRFKLGYKSIVEKIRYTLQGETIVADWDLVPEAEKEAKVPTRPHLPGWTTEGESSEASATSPPSRRASVGISSNNDRWTRIRTKGEGK